MNTTGQYQVQSIVLDHLRLDGGAMFGSVPKNLWEKRIKADSENCVPLVSRSLLLRDRDKVILIDVGCGTKWDSKSSQIFGFKHAPEAQLPFTANEVTHVILTHLHFDHAGGITTFSQDGSLALTYPQAEIILQKTNLENALNPTVKERASYLSSHVDPILKSSKVRLVDGDTEILPGIILHRSDGHTVGQQWVEITDSSTPPLFFLTDLVPTAHHVTLPYHMGYDINAGLLLKEKAAILNRACDEKAIVVFQHDTDTVASTITRDPKGAFILGTSYSI